MSRHVVSLACALALVACADEPSPPVEWPQHAHEYRLDRPTIDRWFTLEFDERGRLVYEHDERSGTVTSRVYLGDFLAEEYVTSDAGSRTFRAEFVHELPWVATTLITTSTTRTIDHRWDWNPNARTPQLLHKVERDGERTYVDSYQATQDGYQIDACIDADCSRYYLRGPFDYVGIPGAWIERSRACADGSRAPVEARTLDEHGQPLVWFVRSVADPCTPGPWTAESRWERHPDGTPIRRFETAAGITYVTEYFR